MIAESIAIAAFAILGILGMVGGVVWMVARQ